MPLDLQVVSPADTLRRAFGMRGRITLQVDETVSPVAIVRNSAQAPDRADGFQGILGASVGASVGNLSHIAFLNDATAGDPIRVVIDSLTITNPGATTVQVFVGYGLSVTAAARRMRTAEFEASGPNLADLEQFLQFTVAVTNPVATLIGSLQADYWLGAGQNLVIPLNLLLRPTLALEVETQAVNVPISASVVARVFRQ